MYLVTAKEMQLMDNKTIESFGLPGRILMENAGRGATQILLDKYPQIYNKKVGVLAGRGNNGGDGFVMARYLAQQDIRVIVYLLSEKNRIKGDARANLNLLLPLGVPVVEIHDEPSLLKYKSDMVHTDVWIDAIFGTGLNSDVTGMYKQLIEFINSRNRYVFSVDIPSGLNADTGQPCGVCIHAAATATFAFPKIGHILYPGADYTGFLNVIDIGIPPYIVKEACPMQQLVTKEMIQEKLRPRSHDAHKGDAGHLFVLAGSAGKTGAAAMTAMSAMRSGAGLVSLGIPTGLNPVLEVLVKEVMTCPLPENKNGMLDSLSYLNIMDLLAGKKCFAVGPGLGTDFETKYVVCNVVENSRLPVVIDADGLNCISGNLQVLKNNHANIVLTPHPGEMARLAGISVENVQKNRISCAKSFAQTCGVHVVLKGARTVVAHPDGKVFINSSGNSGMASGGMGDVLTGIIAGLITQGYSIETAIHAGVYLHGACADYLAETKGRIGFLATDVMDAIPNEIDKLVNGLTNELMEHRTDNLFF